MKHITSASLAFLLLAACSPMEVPTLQVAVVTRVVTPTPQIVIVTATPEPTDTPTLTLTPTATPTLTPTPTKFPERTWNTLVFGTDFSEGYQKLSSSIQGAELQNVPDPTNSGRGIVVKGVITGDPINQGDYYAYRAHVGTGTNFRLEGEARFEEDIWVSSTLLSDATTRGRWFTHQNIFDKVQSDGGEWHVAIRTSVRGGYMVMYLNYVRVSYGSGDIITVPVANAPKFTAEAWHKMAVEIRQEQNPNGAKIWVAYLFQDGQLVSTGELPESIRRDNQGRPVWVGYHGGPIYAGAQTLESAGFTKGGFALMDNIRILK